MKKGFTLIELIVVVIVLGILVAFAVPQYAASKERALDNEAKGYLVLIQAAENLYKIENGAFFKPAGGDTAHQELNDNLGVSLPLPPASPGKLKWKYETKVTEATSSTPATVCVEALRNVEGDSGRSWYMMDTDSTPSKGACP